MHKIKKSDWPLLSMILPGAIITLLLSYIPMAGIVVAFKKMTFATTIWNAPWCGLKNFEFLFATSDIWKVTRNTVLYNVAFIVINNILSVGSAILLFEIGQKKLSKMYQSCIFLPYLFSMVIVAYMVYGFLSTNYGVVNTILVKLGMERIDWYNTPAPWPIFLVIINAWKNMGYGSVVNIAALGGIDTEIFEAAMIDGANRWQKIRYITIPQLSTIIVIQLIMAIGTLFSSDFGLFYTVPMDSKALIPVTNVLGTYVYRALMNLQDTGMSSAAAFYQSFVGLILIFVANTIVTKVDPEKALF